METAAQPVSVLLAVETVENRLLPSGRDLAAMTAGMRSLMPGRVIIAVAGESPSTPAEELAPACGVDVLALAHEAFRYPNPPLLAKALASLCRELAPVCVGLSHTMRGCQTAALLAQTLDAACMTAVEALTVKENRLEIRRPLFNGKLQARIIAHTDRTVLTLMPGALPAPDQTESDKQSAGKVTVRNLDDLAANFSPQALSQAQESDQALEEADVVVSAGRGVGQIEHMEILQKTAGIFVNAALGASRGACDMGLLPYSRQVGETGRRVSPRIYMACGISGSQQHITGMKSSRTIVAVNTDSQAAILNVADYAVIEDLKTFLPLLVEAHQRKAEG